MTLTALRTRLRDSVAIAWLAVLVYLGPRDILLALGVASMLRGLWLVYRPAPWIFFGMLALWIVFRRVPK